VDLLGIRDAVDEFLRVFPVPQDFPATLWSDLITHGFITEPPRNPDSPAPLASRILIVRRPGQTGASVSPSAAGWVWNRADRRLYLAGRLE
jgi:hypothetical protein